VIVDCESCHTRFRLDEARIPAAGAKVRCSKCKAAFHVQRPGATRDEQIDDVVAEATNPGASTAPEATEDLFETSGSIQLGGDQANDEPGSGDEKWEFDDAPPPVDAPRPSSATARSDPASPPARETSGDANDLDALGSPEDWDLLGGGRQLAADARFESPASARTTSTAPARERAESAPQHAYAVESSVAAAVAAAPRSEPLGGWRHAAREFAQALIDSGVWFASIALCGVGLVLALSPRAETPVLRTPNTFSATLDGRELEVARHRIESGVGGMLSVIRGQLPPAPATQDPQRLRAIWLDANGKPLQGGSAIAGRPLESRALREHSLERLREEHEARAAELASGGGFEVVFGALPSDAHGIALRRERAPIPVRVATQSEEAEASAAQTPTTSSRPTARLSSE
jgi:predicted Zn finger-like uncharacterized protein